MSIFHELLCRHDYRVMIQHSIPSEVDMVRQMGCTPNSHQSLTRVRVDVLNCNKCGKVKTLRHKTPR